MSGARSSLKTELARLEEIVRGLEDEEVDLDQALALFEEGVRRLQVARELLERTELTVKRVLEEADGTIRTDDLKP
jgi:exodeoxyribonuclease VII small subunit